MKQFSNLLRVALKSIGKNRMRSLLTSLGIIIGVSAVIIMVAIGEGSQYQIEQNINALGTNLIIIFAGSSSTRGVRGGAGSLETFTLDDVDKLKKEATLIDAVSPIARLNSQIIGDGANWFTSIYGVSTDYFRIRNWEIEDGEFFTDKDVTLGRKVAILGKTVADQLFPNQDPIGKRIRIRNIPFDVIGLLKEKGRNSMGQDQDDLVLAPTTTVLYRLKGDRRINMINASAISTDRMDAAQAEISSILRESHRLVAEQEADFTIRTQSEITEAVTETSRTMTLLLGAIAAVSLIVGGIGIMNIMLVSVTERTREIGIRLSVGARESDIMVQFLSEAVVLSVSGGIIGILLALAAGLALNQFTNLFLLIKPAIIIISFVFSGAIGIFFGFYPARKAAHLNPIDALRYE